MKYIPIITDKKIIDIIKMSKNGIVASKIGKKLGIGRQRVKRIITNARAEGIKIPFNRSRRVNKKWIYIKNKIL